MKIIQILLQVSILTILGIQSPDNSLIRAAIQMDYIIHITYCEGRKWPELIRNSPLNIVRKITIIPYIIHILVIPMDFVNQISEAFLSVKCHLWYTLGQSWLSIHDWLGRKFSLTECYALELSIIKK